MFRCTSLLGWLIGRLYLLVLVQFLFFSPEVVFTILALLLLAMALAIACGFIKKIELSA